MDSGNSNVNKYVKGSCFPNEAHHSANNFLFEGKASIETVDPIRDTGNRRPRPHLNSIPTWWHREHHKEASK